MALHKIIIICVRLLHMLSRLKNIALLFMSVQQPLYIQINFYDHCVLVYAFDNYVNSPTNKLLLLFFSGVGGYSYLYEPLWWVGMITSEYVCSLLFIDLNEKLSE